MHPQSLKHITKNKKSSQKSTNRTMPAFRHLTTSQMYDTVIASTKEYQESGSSVPERSLERNNLDQVVSEEENRNFAHEDFQLTC
jgi:hypothetical protein